MGLLDRRFASRQQYETTDRRPMGRMVDTLLTGTLGELYITKEEPRDARDCTTPPRRGSHIEIMIGRDSPTKSHYPLLHLSIRYTYPPSPAPRNLPFFYLFDIYDGAGEKGLGIF